MIVYRVNALDLESSTRFMEQIIHVETLMAMKGEESLPQAQKGGRGVSIPVGA
jgi:hypothetical protein